MLAAYPLSAPSDAERQQLDPESLAFVGLVGARVPDGRKLYQALSATLRPQPPRPPSLPPALAIAPADVAEVIIGRASVAVVGGHPLHRAGRGAIGLGSRADGIRLLAGGAHQHRRDGAHGRRVLQRAARLARLRHQRRRVAACDRRRARQEEIRTTIPVPVTYRGMPAARFWEFEDARVDFGAVDAAPQDLARMLLVEFAITYGNDWFVLPIDLDVGSLCRTRSLIVTNTFGERFLIPSSRDAGAPYAAWRMFQLSTRTEFGPVAGDDPGLFLPHTLASPLESRPIEDVIFLRDEMANMAWAVERIVESAIERPRNRFEEARDDVRRRRRRRPAAEASRAIGWRPRHPTTGCRCSRCRPTAGCA